MLELYENPGQQEEFYPLSVRVTITHIAQNGPVHVTSCVVGPADWALTEAVLWQVAAASSRACHSPPASPHGLSGVPYNTSFANKEIHRPAAVPEHADVVIIGEWDI